MKETSGQQFGKEITSFFVLVILNLILGALSMAFGLQAVMLTLMAYSGGGIPSLFGSAAVIIIGIAGMGIGIFWIKTSAKILNGIKKIREEYRNHNGPVPAETLTGWIVAMIAHYRENREVIRQMALIGTIGGAVFLAFGITNLVQGIQIVSSGGDQLSGYLALVAAAVNLIIGLVTLHFARGFRTYAGVWDSRLDQAVRGEESLKQALENG
jgi:fumarate reductase subunit C